MKRTLISWLLITSIAGCGNDPDRSDPFAFLDVMSSDDAPAPADPTVMARAGMAQIEGPLMLAVLEDRLAVALLVPYGQNGPVRTWVTAERQTLAVQDGRVIATRGLGHDLMSRKPRGGFRPEPSRAELRTANAANEPVAMPLDCRIESIASRPIALASGEQLDAVGYAEKCTGPFGPVQNDFWVSDGVVRQTRQWLGPEAGYLTLQVLRP